MQRSSWERLGKARQTGGKAAAWPPPRLTWMKAHSGLQAALGRAGLLLGTELKIEQRCVLRQASQHWRQGQNEHGGA